MKAKLKKLGLLVVVLANFVIFAPQKIDGQNTPKTKTKTATEECKDNKTVCIKCGGSCVVLCCEGSEEPIPMPTYIP